MNARGHPSYAQQKRHKQSYVGCGGEELRIYSVAPLSAKNSRGRTFLSEGGSEEGRI